MSGLVMLIIGVFGLFIIQNTKKKYDDLDSYDKIHFYFGLFGSVLAIIIGLSAIIDLLFN